MFEHTGGSRLEMFVHQVRGSKGELGLLLRLVGEVRQRRGARGQEALLPPAQRGGVAMLKARIAELSRSSEKTMRDAAMNVGRIGKALQEQKASAETARQFGPILALLQKRIAHSMQKVRAAKTAVHGLDSMLGTADTKGATEGSPPAESRRRRGGRRAKAQS